MHAPQPDFDEGEVKEKLKVIDYRPSFTLDVFLGSSFWPLFFCLATYSLSKPFPFSLFSFDKELRPIRKSSTFGLWKKIVTTSFWRLRENASISAKSLSNESKAVIGSLPKRRVTPGKQVIQLRRQKNRKKTRRHSCFCAWWWCPLSGKVCHWSLARNVKEILRTLRLQDDSHKKLKMIGLVSVEYRRLRDDISKHMKQTSGLLKHLRSTDIILQDALAIVILIASMGVPELTAVTAFIKALVENDLKWEDVNRTLNVERKTLQSICLDRGD